MSVALYAGSQRSSSTADGRVTRHSFSFGPHYDPANLGFGPLVCHNDDVLDPRSGYPDHPHSELEIVTWVLEGALVHTDSTGERHVVEAGRAQVLSAGTGIRHSEVADPGSGRCRFVQAWLTPTAAGGEPSYVLGEAPPPGSGLVDVAGGDGLPLGTRGARLLVARLDRRRVRRPARRPAPARLRRHGVGRARGSSVLGDAPGDEPRGSATSRGSRRPGERGRRASLVSAPFGLG